MPLEKLLLSPLLIQNLYRNNLVSLQQPEKPAKKKGNVKYLGNNEGQITVLVHYADAAFIPEKQLDFLTKILAACKLTLADIAIVNLASEKNDHEALTKELNSKKVLLFGISPTSIKLPFQIPHFQIQRFNDQEFITAPDLETLESDKELKKLLWTSFQRLFSI